MTLNRKELKKILYDYNSMANRLLKADYQEFKEVLHKFLRLLSACSIINDYLNDCGSPTIPDIEAEVKEVANEEMFFSTGDTSAEENANIYEILKYLANSNKDISYVVSSYSNSRNFNDKIKGFNDRFVMILIRNIEGYLTKLGIDMGVDENVQYNITVNNGQVNIAKDNAVINATLNNGINLQELQALADKVLSESKTGLNNDEVVTVSESVEVIQQELTQEKPKKSVVRGILSTLQGIKGTVEFVVAVTALIQFIQPFIS
jgi:hypothetical protein